jgi:nitroreductase
MTGPAESTASAPGVTGRCPVFDLDATIRERRSIRMFLRDKSVPPDLIDEALELSIRAPSNSNTQPWHLTLTSGAARDRLVADLLEAAHSSAPPAPTIPPAFAHHRSETGAIIYPAMGVRREDKEGRRIAIMRNFEFFGAPIGGVVSVHRDFDYVDSMAVGMFLQTFVLALFARGIGTCVQVCVAGYPDVLRRHCEIPDEYRILSGVAIGYADPDFAANHLDIPRSPIAENIAFFDQ